MFACKHINDSASSNEGFHKNFAVYVANMALSSMEINIDFSLIVKILYHPGKVEAFPVEVFDITEEELNTVYA